MTFQHICINCAHKFVRTIVKSPLVIICIDVSMSRILLETVTLRKLLKELEKYIEYYWSLSDYSSPNYFEEGL